MYQYLISCKTFTSCTCSKSGNKKPDSWGGAISISILFRYFNVEIAVVDIQSCLINRFVEDKFYKERVFLIYDGIHYDSRILEPLEPSQ